MGTRKGRGAWCGLLALVLAAACNDDAKRCNESTELDPASRLAACRRACAEGGDAAACRQAAELEAGPERARLEEDARRKAEARRAEEARRAAEAEEHERQILGDARRRAEEEVRALESAAVATGSASTSPTAAGPRHPPKCAPNDPLCSDL